MNQKKQAIGGFLIFKGKLIEGEERKEIHKLSVS